MSTIKTMSPGRTERLPLDMKEITPAWLAKAFRWQYPDDIVKDFEVVEIIDGHSIKMRLKLDLTEAGKAAGIPEHVCLKGNLNFHLPDRPATLNEARFYGTLGRALSLPAPTCYFADWDDDEISQQGIMIIDDLKAMGCTFSTSARAIDLDDMTRSLERLAKIHGRTWGSEDLKKQTWIQTAMAPETYMDDYWSLIPAYFEAHNKMPERVAIFPEWMQKNTNRLRDASAALRAYETNHPGTRCLIHGDSHLGNTYVQPDGQRFWYDWQMFRKGLPWRDLSYFIVGSITIEDRRKAESDLVRHYLEHLHATGGPKISFDEAWTEYRRYVMWGLMAWQSNINPGEVTMPPLERFCMAAKDHESHKLLDF